MKDPQRETLGSHGEIIDRDPEMERMERRRTRASLAGCLILLVYALLVAATPFCLALFGIGLKGASICVLLLSVAFIIFSYRRDYWSVQHGTVYLLSVAVALGIMAAFLKILFFNS
jgi:hypothetical protein